MHPRLPAVTWVRDEDVASTCSDPALMTQLPYTLTEILAALARFPSLLLTSPARLQTVPRSAGQLQKAPLSIGIARWLPIGPSMSHKPGPETLLEDLVSSRVRLLL